MAFPEGIIQIRSTNMIACDIKNKQKTLQLLYRKQVIFITIITKSKMAIKPVARQ